MGDAHSGKNVTLNTCTATPFNDGEFYQLTQGTSSSQFVYWFNCTAGCTSCLGNVTQYLGVCGPSVSRPDAFVLLTSVLCTGGLDSNSNAAGAVFTQQNDNTVCATQADFRDFTFGTNVSCQPFLDGSFGQLKPIANGNYSANLFCPDATCTNCAVVLANTFGCQINGNGSWAITSLGSLSTCATGSSSKLSTGAIVGIAIGSTVGAIGLIAVIVYLSKSSRGSYANLKS